MLRVASLTYLSSAFISVLIKGRFLRFSDGAKKQEYLHFNPTPNKANDRSQYSGYVTELICSYILSRQMPLSLAASKLDKKMINLKSVFPNVALKFFQNIAPYKKSLFNVSEVALTLFQDLSRAVQPDAHACMSCCLPPFSVIRIFHCPIKQS